ncbi:hypothetical protein HYPBUDRAFT_6417 [Hyphopichia burtonii NRRL Y-1933]|uniref:Potassium channel tetramerisation-type BTB domain-containing protein n=1 Tax=Hyphopichia burtonii NRRL Y-1933 TaxID=984485 RepID=A0A1E4RIN2_9ASCO|nr:hypothetical protein HYPBUDRAFT_6417 [Hyphopichia burtonii NRRL Y-1933]ODV67124.1 hypothetical protein HYPBUDRAFT_6417 [Hyphopichia burtonii NRRL Y-1933]
MSVEYSQNPLVYRGSREFDPEIPEILPHEKVYSIQVGYKLFRLSGASLSSDAPSYFTQFFNKEENTEEILFIDRNPNIFEKIYNHLQGYRISVDTAIEFVHIWSDSYYFGLKRLQEQLSNEDIFAIIGGESFKISKNLLVQSGNYPNYFSINYDSMLTDNLRLIEQKNIIRPPPQQPATVNNRSAKLFGDLIQILKGNTLVIKNDEHRKLLIKECKYYRFLALEQKIIKYKIHNCPYTDAQEIIIDLFDLSSKGIFKQTFPRQESPVLYARPYIKDIKRSLIFQINNSENFNPELKLLINRTEGICILRLVGDYRSKFLQIFRNMSKDFMDEPQMSSEMLILSGLKSSKAVINGLTMKQDWWFSILDTPRSDTLGSASPVENLGEPKSKMRKLDLNSNNDLLSVDNLEKYFKGQEENTSKPEIIEITIIKGLWRVLTRGQHARLHLVSLEGCTNSSTFLRDRIDFL